MQVTCKAYLSRLLSFFSLILLRLIHSRELMETCPLQRFHLLFCIVLSTIHLYFDLWSLSLAPFSVLVLSLYCLQISQSILDLLNFHVVKWIPWRILLDNFCKYNTHCGEIIEQPNKKRVISIHTTLIYSVISSPHPLSQSSCWCSNGHNGLL